MPLTPTTPPQLPADVLAVGRPEIVVTAPDSPLGMCVVSELGESLVPARTVTDAPIGGQNQPGARQSFLIDAGTGRGLDVALQGAGAVIHVAPNVPGHPQAGMTRALLDAVCAWAPTAHVVVVSSIGAWENPDAYYRLQADAENAAGRFTGRMSLVRLTPTHDVLRQILTGPLARLAAGTQDIQVTPVDPRWVARKLVDVALMREPLPVPMELGGPELLTLKQADTLIQHVSGKRRRFALTLPTGQTWLEAFARGVNLPGVDAARGGDTFSQWLADQ